VPWALTGATSKSSLEAAHHMLDQKKSEANEVSEYCWGQILISSCLSECGFGDKLGG
jgi:hypothetical protein